MAGKLENPGKVKHPWNKARTNNTPNSHKAPDRNRTRATLVGGERSHHYAIPALPGWWTYNKKLRLSYASCLAFLNVQLKRCQHKVVKKCAKRSSKIYQKLCPQDKCNERSSVILRNSLANLSQKANFLSNHAKKIPSVRSNTLLKINS